MSSCKVGLLPAAPDDVTFIESAMVAEPFEVIEFLSDFGQLELALDAGFGAKVGLSLSGVGVCLFVGIDHLVMGDPKSVDVGSNSPVVELSSSILDEGVCGGVPGEEIQQPAWKGFDG
jgi:hypothetical protein